MVGCRSRSTLLAHPRDSITVSPLSWVRCDDPAARSPRVRHLCPDIRRLHRLGRRGTGRGAHASATVGTVRPPDPQDATGHVLEPVVPGRPSPRSKSLCRASRRRRGVTRDAPSPVAARAADREPAAVGRACATPPGCKDGGTPDAGRGFFPGPASRWVRSVVCAPARCRAGAVVRVSPGRARAGRCARARWPSARGPAAPFPSPCRRRGRARRSGSVPGRPGRER